MQAGLGTARREDPHTGWGKELVHLPGDGGPLWTRRRAAPGATSKRPPQRAQVHVRGQTEVLSHMLPARGDTQQRVLPLEAGFVTPSWKKGVVKAKKKKTRSPRFELKVSEGTPAIFCLTKWKHVFLTSSPEKVRKNDQFSSYLSTPCTHIMVSNHHFEPEIRALWRYGRFQE